MAPADVLAVGDLLRMSVALVDQLKRRESDRTVLVCVSRIERQPDGTVVLFLENAPEGARGDRRVN